MAIGVATAILVSCAVVRATFWTYGADTGTFAIATQNLQAGMFDPFEGGSHFRYHWSPILALMYPLVALTHSVLSLQIAQVVLVMASVFVFYLLIEQWVQPPLALRCALVALCYPPLVGLAFSEFHELAFAPLLTFLTLLALSRRSWRGYGASLALLLCVREDVAIVTAIAGAALAIAGFRRSDRAYFNAGIAAALGGALVVVTYFLAIVPHLGHWVPRRFYAYANEPTAFSIFGRLTYVLEMFVPLLFLPLRSRWVLLVVPGAAIILLANSPEVWRMGMHYVALWLPWMFVAMAAAVARIERNAGQRVARRWTLASLAACLAFLMFADPTHAAHYLRPSYRDRAAVDRVVGCVPKKAIMGTHDEWYSALAFVHRNETVGAPRYAKYLLFADDYPNKQFQTKVLPALQRQIADGRLDEICRSDNVAVYERTGT